MVVKIMYEPVFHFQYPDLRGSMETKQNVTATSLPKVRYIQQGYTNK